MYRIINTLHLIVELKNITNEFSFKKFMLGINIKIYIVMLSNTNYYKQ